MSRFHAPDMTRLRRYAETLMTDRWRVTRYTGAMETDPDTGLTRPVMRVVYEGKGKLQSSGGVASEQVSATGDSSNVGGNVAEWLLTLHLPASVTGVREKDMAECLASDDPDLIGRRYRFVNMQSEKTHATAKRWNVREIPKE